MRNQVLLQKCEAVFDQIDTLKTVFPMEDRKVLALCANLYQQAGLQADAERLKACKDMLKKKISSFSQIRSLAFPYIVCMVDLRGGEEEHVDELTAAYKALRRHFGASAMLALAAELLAEQQNSAEFAAIAEGAKAIFKQMQKKHPFVTGDNDVLYCVLLAQKGRSAEDLAEAIEQSMVALKQQGVSSDRDVLQAIACALTLADADVNAQCEQVASLSRSIRERGMKYDKYFGLPVLALLTEAGRPQADVLDDLEDANDWLREQKGFGMLMGESNRMVFAAMLVAETGAFEQGTGTVSSSMLSAAMNQQMMIATCVAASSTMILLTTTSNHS